VSDVQTDHFIVIPRTGLRTKVYRKWDKNKELETRFTVNLFEEYSKNIHIKTV